MVGEQFAGLLDNQDYAMITSFRQTFADALRQYFYVGGMPEAVQNFAQEKDFNEVRKIQKRILAAYEQDFSKHAPIEIVPQDPNDRDSIPSQLAREKRKNLCMALCGREHAQRTMRPLLCGFVIADLSIESAV